MSRFSTPDEIFGPVSISELKKDKYVRIIDNYLPAAEVVFLDEIWKAGPSIQNALLTILNEKKFRNGEKEIDVPMKALISASNELPEKEQGLEALWDRFLVRLVVEGIEDKDKFYEMIAMPSTLFDEKVDSITDNEYEEWSKKIDQIVIPENVFNVIQVIRNKIELHNQDKENTEKQIYVSDRRWRKIVRLMRTSAFLNDRKEVDLMDCFLIKHCIWNEEEQRDTVWQFISEAVKEHGYAISFDLGEIRKELAIFKTEIAEETKVFKNTQVDVLSPVYSDYYQLEAQIDNNALLIKTNEFNNLTNQNQYMHLFYWHTSYQQVQNYSSYNIRKGNSKFSVFINDKEFQLKTTKQDKKQKVTKEPHPSVEKDWDERVNSFLKQIDDMVNQIEQYRNKDLEHLRTNLFVDPVLANTVESHISATEKNIDDIDLEIKEIQNNYKKLKEEVVLNA
jgi:MoxR-like ATPase